MKLKKILIVLTVLATLTSLISIPYSALAKHSQLLHDEEDKLYAYMVEDEASPEQQERIISARESISREQFRAIAPIELQEKIRSDLILYEAVSYAYLDIEEAYPSLRMRILEARYLIISNTDWFDDQILLYARVRNPETNEIEELSAFGELFPNWDKPAFTHEFVGVEDFPNHNYFDIASSQLFHLRWSGIRRLSSFNMDRIVSMPFVSHGTSEMVGVSNTWTIAASPDVRWRLRVESTLGRLLNSTNLVNGRIMEIGFNRSVTMMFYFGSSFGGIENAHIRIMSTR